jgi:Mg-chelatase subunit ChlD
MAQFKLQGDGWEYLVEQTGTNELKVLSSSPIAPSQPTFTPNPPTTPPSAQTPPTQAQNAYAKAFADRLNLQVPPGLGKEGRERVIDIMRGMVNYKPSSDEPKPETKPITDSVFRARLSSVMTDNKYDRKLKNRPRGRLDMTRLPKAKTGSQSVFTQKMSRQGKQYNVVLLVDESTSMRDNGGDKIRAEAEATAFLANHLKDLVNLAVVGFGTVDDENNSTVEVLKGFNQKVPELEQLVIRKCQGGTPLWEGLELAYKLVKHEPGQSIVLVLTDGEPNGIEHLGEAREQAYQATREAGVDFDPILWDRQHFHKLIEAQEAVTIGIGIQSKADVIPTNFRIENLDDLKDQILNVLSKHIRRK